MKYDRLGASGVRISAVGLGSWLTVGNTVESPDEVERLVATAVDLGINFLDTADVYARGAAETALGRALQGRRRQHLVIASKCFFPMSDDVNDRGLSRKHVFESLHASLRRLGTDYLDLYQCHRHDPDTPLWETVAAMDDAVRQGKILYWGVSQWPAWAIAEACTMARAAGMHPPVSNQPLYNLFDREIEAEVLPASRAHGVGQVVYSPLAQGVLTGKYRGDALPSGSRAADDRVNQFIGRYLTVDRRRQAAAFADLARRWGHAPSAVALAWCLRRPEVASVIVGASRPEQLRENAAGGDLALTEAELRQLDEMFPA